MTSLLYFVVGAVAGAVQAMMLRRRARARVLPFEDLLRMGVVGAALVGAALGGHLLAGVGGWASAYLLVAAVLVWRWS